MLNQYQLQGSTQKGNQSGKTKLRNISIQLTFTGRVIKCIFECGRCFFPPLLQK